ncbi:uncharacterized protein PY17X_1408800 [Plasmodium yoelii]|uniref:Uncharacterized protein n=2 Tax=Plasmodium yoelii TaxID=5861 RepID=A0AAE9WUV8_PLAYO|nr:uncharacterized protein PY17X_1408800 [Plasmodium yoelii]WBY60641.1 hypothetical protein Py17XNL_001400940 [Plasmodium yoelii yoelii]CDU20442.1 conserved Plasmodium protein, unknown function [Plasmodium yoelii]VTZ81402.1 conserved Plasmodium protein, unknown function [Plasmodium yoelii]|eukprot:XP_724545.2 uncharacterized protein PY17X_1408800 [Plasmodium yoelii]
MDKILHRNKFSFVCLNKRFYITKSSEVIKVKSNNSNNINKKKTRFKNIYIDFSLNKYININSLNVDKFIKTPIHYQSFRELVDTLKCASNVRLQNIHLVRKILNSLEIYIINYLNNRNLYNEFNGYNEDLLDMNENDDDENAIVPNNIVTILISLYKLKYRNVNFLKLVENYIFINKNKFKISHIHLILYIYAYFNRVNKKFINSLLVIILNNQNILNSDNILNIYTSLFYLNCKNETTLQSLSNYIISNKLNFDINVIIFLLNNLKKLNCANTDLLEYFSHHIILKLDLLSPQGNIEYLDSFFLKRNIQNALNENYDEISKNDDVVKRNNTQSPNNKSSSNLDKLIDGYGSLHNKYIVENKYVDYIYEYYNKKDIEDKNKNKINLLMEVLIHYKYFKEDILKAVYEYLLNNLKKFNNEDIYKILSNLYLFEINNYEYIKLLNKKFLLSMCHYYVPFYNKSNIIIFLFLKMLLEKYNYCNIFIDQILLYKIKEEILTLNKEEFLAFLNNNKNTNVIKYLCDISLIYYDFLSPHTKLKTTFGFNGECDNTHSMGQTSYIVNFDRIKKNNEEQNEVKKNEYILKFGLEKYYNNPNDVNILNKTEINSSKQNSNASYILYEFNERNKLQSYDEKYLLDLFYFYVEIEYYEGIFLFLKSLFNGVKCLKKFNPYIYCNYDNYYSKDEKEKLEEKNEFLKNIDKENNIFKKFNALNIIHIYEHFKTVFLSYDDFISKNKKLISSDYKKSLYYFYLSKCMNSECVNLDDTVSPNDERKSNFYNNSENNNSNNYNYYDTEIKHFKSRNNKYLLTNSKINYISYKNKNEESSYFGGNKIAKNNFKLNEIPTKSVNSDHSYNIEENKFGMNNIDKDYKNNENINRSEILFDSNIFNINNYIYNILNNIFIYTPVNLYALYIHFFDSRNIFLLLENIVFKLNYVTANLLSLVIVKIFQLLNNEASEEKVKKKYIFFLNLFHEYLLGNEINNEKFEYKNVCNDIIDGCYNLNWEDKRLIVDHIYLNCIKKDKETSENIKKHIAYILYKNKKYSKYINNDIILNENFLSYFCEYILKNENTLHTQKKNFIKCFYYTMPNKCLYLILNSLYFGKKNHKYVQCVEVITNIFICRYIQYKYNRNEHSTDIMRKSKQETGNEEKTKKVNDKSNKHDYLGTNNDINDVDIQERNIFPSNFNSDSNNFDFSEYSYDKKNKKDACSNEITNEINDSNEYTNAEQVEDNNDKTKLFMQAYYSIVKIRYFHEIPINKHIFRELCINIDYIDKKKFIKFLFFLYKYNFGEIKYILMLQKKCALYMDLYYAHSSCRILEFLCKKLNISIDANPKSVPTKQTSYDYENK